MSCGFFGCDFARFAAQRSNKEYKVSDVVSRLVWAPSGGGKHARASRYLFAALTFAWGKMTRVYEIAS